jgi:hypothetical protein
MTTETAPLSFTFRWDFREHARLSTFLAREQFRQGWWPLIGWGIVLLLGLSVLLSLVSALNGDLSGAIGNFPWIVLMALWLWFLRRGVGWSAAWATRKTDPNVAHPFTYELVATGLRVKTRTTETEIKWDGLHRVRERPEGFLFYYSARLAYQLPKRAIGGDDALRAVRTYIRAHLPQEIEFLPE